MRKKILILSPFYPPNIGGAETFCKGLVDSLDKHDVYVLTYRPFDNKPLRTTPEIEEVYSNFKEGSLIVNRLKWWIKQDKAWAGNSIKNFISVLPNMLINSFYIIKNFEPDIIFCLGLNSAVIGTILKNIFKIDTRCILLALYDFSKKPNIFKFIAKEVLNNMDKVFVEGETGKEDLRCLKISTHVVKFQHWCDQTKFKPKDTSKRECFNVLFVGRPIKEKGIDLIKSVEKNISLKNVRFHYVENVPYKDLPKYYQMADVVVIPSLYSEGFPRVVIEAASSGCAIISSDRGALPELVSPFGMVESPTYTCFNNAICYLAYKNNAVTYKIKALNYALQNFSPKNAEVFLK